MGRYFVEVTDWKTKARWNKDTNFEAKAGYVNYPEWHMVKPLTTFVNATPEQRRILAQENAYWLDVERRRREIDATLLTPAF